MAEPKPMELATLGRPFQLGMLYDARNDMVIPGIALWDKKLLEDNMKEYIESNTHINTITDDSLQKKVDVLGVEGSIKLSLLGGSIKVSGSAKYVDDSVKTSHVARVTLKYHTTTKFQQLAISHLGKGKLDHLELFDLNTATHVVTAVTYGAEAFFIFDRTLSEKENKTEVNGELEAVIKKIEGFKVDAEVKFNLNENERNFVDKLNCTFYGDFKLDTNPCTFEDAIRIYTDLPKYLGDKQQYAVPKNVSLYPLHLLDSKATKIVRDISSNVVDYCVKFLQDFQELEIRVLDLMKSKMFNYFSYMKQQLSDFVARLSELERVLKKDMVKILSEVRGGDSEESILVDLFKKVDLSPFHKRKLTSWIEDKEKEVSVMEQFIRALTEDAISNIIVKSSSLDEAIGDIKYECILCLSFRFIDENDPQLLDMLNYLQIQPDSNNQKSSLAWFKDHDILRKTRTILRQFIEFAAANPNTNNIKFVVNEEYSKDGVKQALLVLYENGAPSESFMIPSKPDAPHATNVTDDSITVKWEDVQTGSETIKNYKIMYQEDSVGKQVVTDKNPSEAWTHIETNDNAKMMHILSLPSGASFIFKVQSVIRIGFSTISENSRVIATRKVRKLFVFRFSVVILGKLYE